MANLPLAFGEILVGAIILDAGVKGDSIANVVQGKATQHPLPGSSSSSGTSSAPAASSPGVKVPAGTYINPFPGARTGRIDQGVDYTGTRFLAPGKSQILIADQTNSGWGGGGYIAAKLLDGPLAGTVYYIAEGVAPLVKAGQTVAAGTDLARPVSNPYNAVVGNIEAGWADPSSPGRPLAQSLKGYTTDQSAPGLTAGYSFSMFVKSLGGVAGEFQGAGAQLAHLIESEFERSSKPAGVPYG